MGRIICAWGVKGIDKAVWKAEAMPTEKGPGVRSHAHQPDKEEGYPGTADISGDVIR